MRKWGAKKEGCGRPELDLSLMWGTMTASVFLPCYGKTAHAPRRNRAGGPACRALDLVFNFLVFNPRKCTPRFKIF